MTWQQWVLIGWLVASQVYVSSIVGKPREPYTGGDIAASAVLVALLIALVVSL